MKQQEFRNCLTDYAAMSYMLKTCGYQEILETAAALKNISAETLAQYPMGGYSKGMGSGAYEFVLKDLQRNVKHYDWLFLHLSDDVSQAVFTNLIAYRIVPASVFLKAAYDDKHSQYFDTDIVSCGGQEVFVDCGGFIGDTVEEFIRLFKHYKHIYVYEPFSDNIGICRENLAKYGNVTVRPCGVGERGDCLSICGGGSSGSFMAGQHGSQEIPIVSLDEDIGEKVTFIKMDIEGSEISALLGAKRHIRNDFPKLAVCTYHIISDMWEIPKLIDAIRPGYRFYIRHYHFPENWETVIYAVPPKQEDGEGR